MCIIYLYEGFKCVSYNAFIREESIIKERSYVLFYLPGMILRDKTIARLLCSLHSLLKCSYSIHYNTSENNILEAFFQDIRFSCTNLLRDE